MTCHPTTKHPVAVETLDVDIPGADEPVVVRQVSDMLDWSEPYSEPDPYDPTRRV
jgi:hypothetical protein